MKKNITDIFVDRLYNLKESGFSKAAIHQAKRCLVDYIGVTFAGASMLGSKGFSLLQTYGTEPEEAAVIGFDKKSGILNSAFINGISSHAAELDDGVITGIVHPGAPIFSALLPFAEKEKCSWKDFLSGIIIGYEAAVRIAAAIQPSHKKMGYHATATCGAIGAAAAIASMLDFTKQQFKSTVSAAVVSASGTLKVLEDDSELKPYNAGQAAVKGVMAASVGRAGFAGPIDVFSGAYGFFLLMSEKYDISPIINKVENNRLGIEEVYHKPYAACRYCHPAIDAVLKIRTNTDIDPNDIQSISVLTYYWAVAKHDHTQVNGVASAKMSIPYSVAVTLLFGKAGLEEFSSKYIHSDKVYSLMKKITVEADEELTKLFPTKSPAIVKIFTTDGRTYSEKVDYPKGEPETPLSDDELIDKFISLSRYSNQPEEKIAEITNIILSKEKNLYTLFKFL